MMIHDITAKVGRHKQSKRVGRGRGAGGKRAGRGQKGAGSRSGNSRRAQFEGGQMPYFRRLAKYGFSNAQFTTKFWIVNLRSIIDHKDFASGGDVTAQTLIKAGLIRDESRDVKILGDLGDRKVGVKLNVNVSRVSAKARKTIEDAGGAVTETGTRRDRVRGVDRNAEDKTPKNLTKKLGRFRRRNAPAAAPAGDKE